VNIDDFSETSAGAPVEESVPPSEVTTHLNGLPKRQRDVSQSIAVDSASIKETAAKLSMTEGAVRQTAERMTMDTNDLIRTLAADNDTHERSVGHSLSAASVLAVPVSTASFSTGLGVRSDVMTAVRNPMFDLKFA
ncbi:hypothetical protein OY671_012716, partial [Metschnikowia pulcherrima]